MIRTDNRFLLVFATLTALFAVFFAPASQAGEGALLMPDAPKALPAITYLDEKGMERTLSEHKGKAVLVHFWASWCAPCIDEMPKMAKAVEQIGSDALVFLPLSLDRSMDKISVFFLQHSLTMPVVMDAKGKAMNTIGVRGLPSTVLINAQGEEVARREGPVDWESEAVLTLIRETMSGPESQM